VHLKRIVAILIDILTIIDGGLILDHII